MKKDIFNGKIKKEYFSYILVCMIFFFLLLVGVGALCVYASVWEMTANTLGERLSIAAFGVIVFILAFVYLFLDLLVIRRFPKYEKIRRALFNSDCYFTESNSNKYYGRGGARGRIEKLAFGWVTRFARAEKGMGSKKPVQYIIYNALAAVMALLGIVVLVVAPLLFENGVLLPKVSDGDFVLCCIFAAIICIALAVFFLARAFKAAIMASLDIDKWKYELCTSLVDIAVRKNNKKLKFWYDKDQLDQIEILVKSASENVELKLGSKGNKLISFTVIDTLNSRVIFTGLFI